MKTRLKPAATWLIPVCVLATTRAAWPASAPAPLAPASIQAIQQAPDPSAVVTAYANSIALDRSDPKLHEAYVARMVDLGLPELAYHQAQTLTTLQSSNGLAWGVVAYVDARRGQMADAISAINLACHFAPENAFVAHTAGELVAWYDLKADKTTLPEDAKRGLAATRALLAKQIAFTGAYETACRAYQAQATAQAAPWQYAPAPQAPGAPPLPAAPAAPLPPQAALEGDTAAPLGYEPPAVPPPYYPDYADSYYGWAPDFCDDWGPGWIAPAPGCWWEPCGFWGGCGFLPFGAACLFGDFGYGRRFGHGHQWGRNGAFGPGGNPGVWHNATHGANSFFGTPARPSSSVAQWAYRGSQGQAALTTAGTGSHWRSGAGERGSASATGPALAGRTDSGPSRSAPRAASHGGGGFFGFLRGSHRGGSSGGFHGGGRSFGGGFHGGGHGGGGHGGGGHPGRLHRRP